MIVMGMQVLGMALEQALVTSPGLAQSMISLKRSLRALLGRSAVRERSGAQTCAMILLSPLRKPSLVARNKSSYLDGKSVLAVKEMVRNLPHLLLVVRHAREQLKFVACNNPFLSNVSMSLWASGDDVKLK